MQATAPLYETQPKIYPREIKGHFQMIRFLSIGSVLVLYYGLAWLDWEGRQAVLFDLPARQFHIFSLTFWPQDFYLLTWLLIIGALSLFLVTAIAGRLWCGYSCPQTVWSELFLWLERLTEGHYRQRKALDAQPWRTQERWHYQKIFRKLAKHTLWICLAFWTGFTFVGYFTPIKILSDDLLNWHLGGWEGFWLLFYGFATYGNAGCLREQICQYLCPYARFQSAMLDKHSLVIAYDQQRGEPRRQKTVQQIPNYNIGDCINCQICVQVCPTGIDIRKGLQYECIGCAACIDACDHVMQKTQQTKGLIRYSSDVALQTGQTQASLFKSLLRPRIMMYSSLWLILVVGFIGFISQRSLIDIHIERDRNGFYQVVQPNTVDNVYQFKLMNKANHAMAFSIHLPDQIEARILYQPNPIIVDAQTVLAIPVRVRLPEKKQAVPDHLSFMIQAVPEVPDQNTPFDLVETQITESAFWYPSISSPSV